jgi:hypothetical protein
LIEDRLRNPANLINCLDPAQSPSTSDKPSGSNVKRIHAISVMAFVAIASNQLDTADQAAEQREGPEDQNENRLFECPARALEMFPLLLFLVFALLVAIGLARLLTKRQLPSEVPRFQLSDHSSRSLFGDWASTCSVETSDELRKALLARAQFGDRQALVEAAKIRESDLYDEVLDTLVELTSSRQEEFDALVSHILKHNLRANSNLANRSFGQFRTTPERRRTAEILHLAALAYDAATFEKAVDMVLLLWSEGRLDRLPSEELQELFESEYWVISSEARRSGAGFALKQRLAEVRRQLAIAKRRV